ncbi:MAG: uroporphyrinogen decarboxylase family protein, partial [Acetobacteraceae bacterium]
LDRSRVAGAISPILETVRRVAATLPAVQPGAALIGFAGAPFTVACYMVEGGGSKDFFETRWTAYRDPGLFAALIDVLTEATEVYLAGQIEAGAEVAMLFDSWAGILSPAQFRAHVIAPTKRIVASLKSRFPSVPVVGFPRLAGLMLGAYADATGVDAVGVDTGTDIAVASGVVPSSVALQGNLDPVALVAGGEVMASGVGAILGAMRGRPFVFNLGHGILPQTPPEHVAQLVGMVRAG